MGANRRKQDKLYNNFKYTYNILPVFLHIGQKVAQPAFVPSGANQSDDLKLLSASGEAARTPSKGELITLKTCIRVLFDFTSVHSVI